MAENKTGFNLADALAGVSKLDTGADGRDQIEYIDIDRIDDDPNNFYELSSLDELAANIELFGLQQPLRVRPNPEDASRVILVSGHRRRAAIRQLVGAGRADLREIACIREKAEGSAALQELRLIYANSDTRKLSSAEISKQAERVEALLYQLKEDGYEFPGRMRDHVAEACKVSKTKLARLKMIRDKLDKVWVRSFEKGDLKESVAYALAQMPAKHQQAIFQRYKTERYIHEGTVSSYGESLAAVEKVTCKKQGGAACTNSEGMIEAVMERNAYSYSNCTKCCDNCASLAKCKHACPMLAEKVKKLKADASAQRKQEKLEQEEKDRPIISQIMKYWNRFGEARNAADKSVKECYKAMDRYYSSKDEDETWKLECLEAKFTKHTSLPYGYCCTLDDVQRFVRIADLLGCSLDYLLCRTDDPKGFAAPATAATQAEDGAPVRWMPGDEKPKQAGQLAAGLFMQPGMKKPMKSIVVWQQGKWCFSTGESIGGLECVGWYPLPKEDDV